MQKSLANVTLLIHLPVCPAFHVQASEPTISVYSRVDAHGVPDVSWLSASLRRVASPLMGGGPFRARSISDVSHSPRVVGTTGHSSAGTDHLRVEEHAGDTPWVAPSFANPRREGETRNESRRRPSVRRDNETILLRWSAPLDVVNQRERARRLSGTDANGH